MNTVNGWQKLRRMVLTAPGLFLAFYFTAQLAVATEPATTSKIRLVDLHAYLQEQGSKADLDPSVLNRYPKLRAILRDRRANVGSHSVSESELVAAIALHVQLYRRAFSVIDINHDGRLTPLEVSIRAPRLSAFFTRLDIGGKGHLSLKDLLASAKVLDFSPENKASGKSIATAATSVGVEISSDAAHVVALESGDRMFLDEVGSGSSFSEPINQGIAYQPNNAAKLTGISSVSMDGPQIVEPVIVTAGPDDDDVPLGGGIGDGYTEIIVGGFEQVELTQGKVCRAACWALGAAVCATVSALCVPGTVITVGGLAIPCTAAIIATCTIAAGGSSICSDICPP